MKVSTTYSFEITLDLTGAFVPAQADTGPTYSSGGEPGWDAYVEDIDIEGMQFERVERVFVPHSIETGELTEADRAQRKSVPISVIGKFENRIVAHDLFRGVDKSNPEILKLMANIVEAVGKDAEAEMLAAYQRCQP